MQEAPDHKFISEHIPDVEYKDWLLADGGGIRSGEISRFAERSGSSKIGGAAASTYVPVN